MKAIIIGISLVAAPIVVAAEDTDTIASVQAASHDASENRPQLIELQTIRRVIISYDSAGNRVRRSYNEKAVHVGPIFEPVDDPFLGLMVEENGSESITKVDIQTSRGGDAV